MEDYPPVPIRAGSHSATVLVCTEFIIISLYMTLLIYYPKALKCL